jgi:hypothetical protein
MVLCEKAGQKPASRKIARRDMEGRIAHILLDQRQQRK